MTSLASDPISSPNFSRVWRQILARRQWRHINVWRHLSVSGHFVYKRWIKMSVEQRTAIKFCVLNGKNRKETMEMLVKAYGDAAMKRTALHKWYSSRYENGYESVMDDQRSGRLTSITSQKVQEIKELDKERRITIREVSQRVDCSVGTVHTIIHENLNMRWLCARWIPKMLSECQKAQRVESCQRFVQRFEPEGEDFLSRIVTADETCVRRLNGKSA